VAPSKLASRYSEAIKVVGKRKGIHESVLSIYSTVHHTPKKSPIRAGVTALNASPRGVLPKTIALIEPKTVTSSPRSSQLKKLRHRLKHRDEPVLSLIEEPVPITETYHTNVIPNFEI